MPITQSEAEKLARECLGNTDNWNFPDWVSAAQKLAQFILSGNMKREIENAAYARGYKQAVEDVTAKQPCTAENPREDAYQHGRFDGVMDYGRAIRSLIQPPAQKEDGK